MSEVKIDGNNLVNKWEKTGLLEATHPQDRFELATLLEDLCQYLINRKADELQKKLVTEQTTEEIAGFVLPVLVRLYNERREVCPKDMGWLLEDFEKYYSKKREEFRELKKHHDIDEEAEFCGFYVDFFGSKWDNKKGVV